MPLGVPERQIRDWMQRKYIFGLRQRWNGRGTLWQRSFACTWWPNYKKCRALVISKVWKGEQMTKDLLKEWIHHWKVSRFTCIDRTWACWQAPRLQRWCLVLFALPCPHWDLRDELLQNTRWVVSWSSSGFWKEYIIANNRGRSGEQWCWWFGRGNRR